jgi:hypothetical protein
MKDNRPDRPSQQLRTLERWRTLELEDAQAHYAEQARIAAQKQADVDRVAGAIADTQSLLRDQLSGGAPLSVDSLRRLADYSAQQTEQMQQAEKALEKSKADSEQAQAAMAAQFEQLTVVEKLRARRDAQLAKEALQLQQKHLDEHALNRAGVRDAPARTQREE